MQNVKLNNVLKSLFLVLVFFRSLIRPNVKEAWLTLFKRDIAY